MKTNTKFPRLQVNKTVVYASTIIALILTNSAYPNSYKTTLIEDNFNTDTSYIWTKDGVINSSKWVAATPTNTDWGARRNGNMLELSNDVSSTANTTGYIFSSVKQSDASVFFLKNLKSSPGTLTWTFNFRTNRSSILTGFGSTTTYGAAFILASTISSPYTSGSGYAVIMTGSDKNGFTLVKFSNGIKGNNTQSTLATLSSTLSNNTNFASICVTYQPSNHTWTLYARDDGNSKPGIPDSGTYSLSNSVFDSTYTSLALPYSSVYWQGSTAANQTLFIDNYKLSIESELSILSNVSELRNFQYDAGNGPSASQSFLLSGNGIPDSTSLKINGMPYFEISNDSINFADESLIKPNTGLIPTSKLYVRLKNGLPEASYTGQIACSISNTTTLINCQGTVLPPPLFFKSKVSGNWNSSQTWLSSTDSLNWNEATRVPTYRDLHTTISEGTNITIDQATVVGRTTLTNTSTLYPSEYLTLYNGIGDDLTILEGGTMILTSLPTLSSATIRIKSGGRIRLQTGGLIGKDNDVNSKSYLYDDGAILEWKYSSGIPATTGITFFPYTPAGVYPIFRITNTKNSPFGGSSPTIINGVLELGTNITLNGNFSVQGLIINQDVNLNLNPGKQLSIKNKLINNGLIYIESSTEAGTATILTPTTVSDLNMATVEQYLPQGRNWYISSPVNEASASSIVGNNYGKSIAFYQESSSSWIDNYTGILYPGRGYVSISDSGTTASNIKFNGNLNTGSYQIALTRQGSYSSGYNLIGNPYPSYLDITTAIKSSVNIEPTAWYRTYSSGTYYFETVNINSGIGTNNSGTGAVTGLIPPMQAFWLRTITDNNIITFTNEMRYHANPTINGSVVATTKLKTRSYDNNFSIIRLSISNGSISDETIIYSNPNASNQYDLYDSPKRSNNNVEIPELFSICENKKLVINGLSSLTNDSTISLGFTPGKSGSFMIALKEIVNLDSCLQIILTDNELKKEIILNDSNTYTFYNDANINTKRLNIRFKKNYTDLHESNQSSPVKIFTDEEKNICIIYPGAETIKPKCTVYNNIGQLVSQKTITVQPYIIRLKRGTYLVKVGKKAVKLSTI